MANLMLPLQVAPRYTRSVHLTRDFEDRGQELRGYQITPLVLQSLERVMIGLQPSNTDRSFSLVGPYGAGKSAFAVFLARYLQSTSSQRRILLDGINGTEAPGPMLYDGPQLLPVLVSGNNGSLRPAIIRALAEALRILPGLEQAALPTILQSATDQTDVDPQTVADAVAQAAQMVRSSGHYNGLVLMIDELGQFLNYTAQRGDERDLFVLQTLAEMANRSSTPCVVLTILHQSFDRYTFTAGTSQRTEWAKVQGRFADLPFVEPATQQLRMIAHALAPNDQPLPPRQREWGARAADLATTVGLCPADMDQQEWQRVITHAYPLHPTVLAALPLLFRQLAQNERSLFAFLSSQEPGGLQDFYQHARTAYGDDPIYRLPHLWNYIEATLGTSLFSHARGQRWAELTEARAALGEASATTRDVLTSIGMMGALGQRHGLRASTQQLSFALHDRLDGSDVDIALNLLRERRQIVFRQFRGSYAIWEGSDLDLDALILQTRGILAERLSLVELLREQGEHLPLIARRFSYETGAVRTFSVRYVDIDAMTQAYAAPQANGEVLFVVAPTREEIQKAWEWARHPDRRGEVLRVVVTPKYPETLRDILLEVAALQYVLANEGALEHDRSARREVAGRLSEAQHELNTLIEQVYGVGQSVWFWCGEEQTVLTERHIDELLSRSCATALPDTPRIWNELIVRRQLSASAAKARRNLIEAMLDHGHEAMLGLTGYPPERAIYESVFRASGIHQAVGDVWEFGPPPADDPLHVAAVWTALQHFIDSSAAQPQPLTLLYATLEAPPYGVKTGLLPLLLMAAYLANVGDIALYEHGNYVPVPDIAVFERMLRQPSYFALRQSRVQGVRVAVFERLARTLAPRSLEKHGQPALLDAVTPLLRLVKRLPAYSRTTSHVSPTARSIRQTLLAAPAPDVLLFEALPAACGVAPFPADQPLDDAQVEQFFVRLRTGLEELQSAYDRLKDEVVAQLSQAFGANTTALELLHTELLMRYRLIAGFVSDNQLRSLGVRLESTSANEGWIESVAALIGGKPLDAWNDADGAAWKLAVADLGRRFQLIEHIVVVTRQLPPDTPVLRVGVADARKEQSAVVSRSDATPESIALRQELTHALGRHATSHMHHSSGFSQF